MSYAIDPELTPILELIPSLGIEDPVAARAGFEELVAVMNADLDESGVDVRDEEAPGPEGDPPVVLRIYTPEGLDSEVPGLLYIHGGGFVIGSLDSEHGRCLSLCRELGIVVSPWIIDCHRKRLSRVVSRTATRPCCGLLTTQLH